MLIGIISDTHDNMPKIKRAVEIFNARNVGFVIHVGDYVAPFAVIPLNDLKCQYIGVFGNNDGERLGLSKRSQGRINVQPQTLELEGKKILIMHEPFEIDALVKSQNFDIIIFGHNHESSIEKHGRTLVINPGECGGWLSGKSTIVVANLDDITAEMIPLI